MLKRRHLLLRDEGVIHVLVIEDDDDDFYIFKALITLDKRHKYKITQTKTLKQACQLLKQKSTKVDIVFLDLMLQDSKGISTLSKLMEQRIDAPVIILTGIKDESLGIEAIKLGAEDYIPKNEANGLLISRIILYAIERFHLIKQATHDPLTHLLNRKGLTDRLNYALSLSNRYSSSLAVCLLDLDGFKEVNDTLGHYAGDQLLLKIAKRLQENVREIDIVARLGGDEFVLAISNFSEIKHLKNFLNRLLQALIFPYEILLSGQVKPVVIGVSMGVVIKSPEASSIDTLLQQADHAMYESKRLGKNRITFQQHEVSSIEL